MGYTHYWKSGNSSAKINKATQKTLLAVIERGVEAGLVFNDFTVTADTVRFDGVGDAAHETFFVKLPHSSDYCITAQKPYDVCVVACLMILEANVKGFSWSSDGDVQSGDFEGACQLLSDMAIPYNFLKYEVK